MEVSIVIIIAFCFGAVFFLLNIERRIQREHDRRQEEFKKSYLIVYRNNKENVIDITNFKFGWWDIMINWAQVRAKLLEKISDIHNDTGPAVVLLKGGTEVWEWYFLYNLEVTETEFKKYVNMSEEEKTLWKLANI